VNSFQTERAIATLNALSGNVLTVGGCLSADVAAEGAGLGKPPQPPYPRISALRLDGAPWKYPLVPLKLGVFQELRDSILSGEPYQAHGWFIARQNPILSLPDRSKTLEAFGKMDFIATVDIIETQPGFPMSARSVIPERFDPLLPVGDKTLSASCGRAQESRSAWIYSTWRTPGTGRIFRRRWEDIRQQIELLGASQDDQVQRLHPNAHLDEERNRIQHTCKIEVYSEIWPTLVSHLVSWDEPPQPARHVPIC
jgi:thiosulfate reductase/polysulfide reductase chain A